MDASPNPALLDRLRAEMGAAHVLTGEDAGPYGRDWTGMRVCTPLAVARPGSTEEVSRLLRLASESRTPVVAVSGNTGLTGAAQGEGALLVTMERMAAIREIREDDRVAVVEAGVVVQSLQDAAEARGLAFPLAFGARGTARVGGVLSTNAGGANALRHGSARALCLGVEVVLADGRVLDLMGSLRKDNSGYDLRDLFVGAEGTLGLITAAVLRLVPLPRARATAMVAAPSLGAALTLLNRLQDETAGQVEAFEYMPAAYVDAHLARFPEARPPFAERHAINLLVEIGATAARDAEPRADGAIPVVDHLETVLGEMAEAGLVIDAVVARSEAQRGEMWARREAAAAAGLRLGARGRPRRGGAAGRGRGVPGARGRGRGPHPARGARRERGASGRRERPLHRAVAPSRPRAQGAGHRGRRGGRGLAQGHVLGRARGRHAQAGLDGPAQGPRGARRDARREGRARPSGDPEPRQGAAARGLGRAPHPPGRASPPPRSGAEKPSAS